MSRTNVGFSTLEAANAAAISERQASYWAASGLLAPTVFDKGGKGNHRRYSIPDVLALAALGAMRAHDVSLQALREVKRFLSSQGITEFQNIHRSLCYAPGSKRHPHDIALLKDSEIISLLREPGQLTALAVVDLGELDRQVRARLDRIPQERKDHEIEKENQRAERKRAKSVQQRRIAGRAA